MIWLRFRIKYIGSRYIGWQRQHPKVDQGKTQSIQHVYENALQEILRNPNVVASGVSRTDNNVNALDQVVFAKIPDDFNMYNKKDYLIERSEGFVPDWKLITDSLNDILPQVELT